MVIWTWILLDEPCWNIRILQTQRQGYHQPRWCSGGMSGISFLSSLTSPSLVSSGACYRRIERGHLLRSYTMTGRRLAMGTRKMPPLSVGDKVLVQNQTGRVPNKWDMSGVIVECKPYDGW